MKVVFGGSKTVSVRCLEWLARESDAEVLQVFGNSDKKAALDWQESLEEKARELGIPFTKDNINRRVEDLRRLEPDIIFSVQYAPLVKKAVLELPPKGVVNLHQGDLPRYGGCSPVYAAMLNGEKEVAVTLHYMDEKFDTGDIIAKKHLNVGENEISGELFERMADAGFRLFVEQYFLIRDGTNERTPQKTEGGLYYTHNAINLDTERKIRWNESTSDVHNRIRTFTFPARGWKAISRFGGSDITVEDSLIERWNARIDRFGKVVGIESGRVYITARDGIVSIGKIDGVNAEEYFNLKENRNVLKINDVLK